jgi:hypothetical protein
MALLAEHWQDEQGNELEYWRIEKTDSAIVLPVQGDRLLLPPPMYRPGVGEATLDFPGGRVPEGKTPAEAAPLILQRELGVDPGAIARIIPLNTTGWPVNSSFSNQRLYGFVAEISAQVTIAPAHLGVVCPMTPEGIATLLAQLTCLQCRAVLLEWLSKSKS